MLNVSRFTLLTALSLAGCKSAPEPAPSDVSARPVMAAPPAPQAQHAPAKVYDEQATEITAKVGERFEVALPANITTPFKWNVDESKLAPVAKLSEQSYADEPPADCAGCVGYPGVAHFVFEALQAGSVTLEFAYHRVGRSDGDVKRRIDLRLTVLP